MSERNATYAAGMGAGVGSIGSVSAVSALGVPGLGATGITSGLAAIGNVVGGGMAAGLGVTVAAPVVIGVFAYGVYKWFED